MKPEKLIEGKYQIDANEVIKDKVEMNHLVNEFNRYTLKFNCDKNTISNIVAMIKAISKGEYSLPIAKLIPLIAGILYIVTPIDFIPEAVIPIMGFVDDALVLTYITKFIDAELKHFANMY